MTDDSEQKNDTSKGNSRLDDVAEFVGNITRLMTANDLRKFDFKDGDFEISLRRQSSGPDVNPLVSPQPGSTGHDTEESPAAAGDLGVNTIKAPMIGTFYSAPAPGEASYVSPGDTIEEGDVVGIIEAMKIMNEIAADCSGEIVEVVAENGQTVEFGSPLMRVRPVT